MKNKIKFFLLIVFFSSSFLFGQQPQHFTFTQNTGNNAIVSIPTTANPLANNLPLEDGDEIAVFTQTGLCVGATVWTGQNTGITVWGDNDRTNEIDGLGYNEEMSYRIWKKSENREYLYVTVTYSTSNPLYKDDGLYTPNALYVITEMSGLSSPNRPILVYPSNGQTALPLDIDFLWDTISHATDFYVIQIAKDTFFYQIIFTDSTSSNTILVENLERTAKYYWRIAGINTAGISPLSDVWSFYTIRDAPNKPVLIYPANNASGLQSSFTLAWNSSERADYYEIEIATNIGFTSIFKADSVKLPFIQIENLLTNEKYYWRVRAFNESGPSPYSDIFAFNTLPFAPILVSPANEETGISILPSFLWTAVPNATSYSIIVTTDIDDPRAIVLYRSDITTNSFTAFNPLKNDEIYYWMVNANISGNTTPWSNTYKFKTKLPTPYLYSPLNNTTSVSVKPTFLWSPITNASYYRIQIAESSNFTNIIMDQSGIGNPSYLYNGTFKGLTTYYWRVSAINYEGTSDWSTTNTFTTLLTAPPPPNLLSPPNNSGGTQLRPNFIWEQSHTATSYTIQVTNNLYNWNDLVFYRTGVPETYTSINVDLDYYTDYYWRVAATNSIGRGEWSTPIRFTTKITAPTIYSPVNGSSAISITPKITWYAVPGASSYNLQISNNPYNWSTPVVNRTNITENSFVVTTLLEYNTTYYARVSASNADGMSDWSSIISFETSMPAPNLHTPLGGATGVILTPYFEWSYVGNATSYHLQISENIDNWYSLILDQADITTNSLICVATLQNFKTYYWRVRAVNYNETSEWSVIRQFTTKVSAPILIHPANNETWQHTIPQFMWGPVSGATSYAIQVSTSEMDWNNLVINMDPVTTTTIISPVSLSNNRNYYWRVAANSGSGKSDWSEVFTFKTYPAYPLTISLSTTINFPNKSDASKYNSDEYKLIGLPGTSNILVASLFTTERKKHWNAFWDNGQASNYMIEYDGSEIFRFRFGKAFWIISNSDIHINQSVQTAPLNSQLEVEIPLQSGWNIITNPYLYNINWERVQQHNNINVPLWDFRGSFHSSNILETYKGYYLHNSHNLSHLKIPYSFVAADITDNSQSEKEKPEVNIDISFKSYYKDTKNEYDNGSVKIGIANNLKELESFNYKKPKSSLVSKNIALNKYENPVEDYATDYRRNISEYEKWDFTIKTLDNENNIINFSNIASLPLHYEIYLLDHQNQMKVNLRIDSSYSFYSKTRINKFSIFIGKESAIQEEIDNSNKPEKFEIMQNYPNPFNPTTNIPVQIANASMIKIKIYDILGKEIYTLFDGNLEKGIYIFDWRGIDNNGINLPSGIYLIRMFSPSNNLQVSRKIMLLK